MKAVVIEDCKVAPNGYVVISLSKGQEIDGELADFCVEAGHAEYLKVIEAAQPKVNPKPKFQKPAKPKHEG
jgi:hypothetical protein